MKLIQPLQIRYVWRYLCLWVSPTGALGWRWQTHCKKELLVETVAAWREDGVEAIVWDNAPSHHAKLVRATGVPLIGLPSYSPELNPAERVFEEVRRVVEGYVYPDIEAKQAAADRFLQELAADPARVRSLAGWQWITEELAKLPAANTISG